MIKHEMTFTKKKPNSWATYFFMLLTPQLAYLTETSISRRNYLYYNSVCNIFFRKECSSPPYLGGGVVLSEFGGIQLEFRYLSHILNDPVYFEDAEDTRSNGTDTTSEWTLSCQHTSIHWSLHHR
jgi:hypothetical protein